MEELKAMVFDLDPDIVSLCESWTNEEHTASFLSLPGYDLVIRRDRSDTEHGVGGGLLLYVKSCLNVAENDAHIFKDFNQSCCVKLQLQGGSELSLVLVYRPHRLYRGDGIVKENNTKLCTLIRNVQRPSVIMGDFNFSEIDWNLMSSSSQSSEFVEVIQDCFYTQHVDFATREAPGTMPDLFLSSNPNQESKEQI